MRFPLWVASRFPLAGLRNYTFCSLPRLLAELPTIGPQQNRRMHSQDARQLLRPSGAQYDSSSLDTRNRRLRHFARRRQFRLR